MAEPQALPQVGEVWRERRRQYALRTVRVTRAEQHPYPWNNGFIGIETITTTSGKPPQKPVRTQVRTFLWHRTFEKVADAATPASTEGES